MDYKDYKRIVKLSNTLNIPIIEKYAEIHNVLKDMKEYVRDGDDRYYYISNNKIIMIFDTGLKILTVDEWNEAGNTYMFKALFLPYFEETFKLDVTSLWWQNINRKKKDYHTLSNRI